MVRSTRSATEFSSRTLSLLLSLTLALGPVAARAEGEEDQAKALFKKGMTAYDLGDFDGALKLYSDAYQLSPRPGFLFNIAQCYRQQNNYERAAFFYGRFVDTSKPKAANVDLATQLAAEMKAKLAEKVAAEKTEEARKQEQARAEEARRPEGHPSDVPVVTHLTPNPGELPPPPPPPMEEEAPAYKKWWFWTLIGVGVAAVATGTSVAVVASQPGPQPRDTSLMPIGSH